MVFVPSDLSQLEARHPNGERDGTQDVDLNEPRGKVRGVLNESNGTLRHADKKKSL